MPRKSKRAAQAAENAWYALPGDWDNPNLEATVFPGFPGVWRRGEAQSAVTLGIAPRDLDRLIREYDLPLKKTASAPKGHLPEVLRVVPGSSADIASDPDEFRTRSWSPLPGLSADEYRERVAWERDQVENGELRQVSAVLEHLEERGGLANEPDPLLAPSVETATAVGTHPMVAALDDREAARKAARATRKAGKSLPAAGATGDTSGDAGTAPAVTGGAGVTPTATPAATATNTVGGTA